MAHTEAPASVQVRGVSLFSWTTGSFMDAVVAAVAKGAPAPLVEDAALSATDAHAAFSLAWAAETSAAPARGDAGQPSVVRALWKAFHREMLIAAVAKAGWGAGIVLSASLFVRSLLAYVGERAKDPVRTSSEEAPGFIWTAFFFVVTVLLSLSLQQMSALSAR
jgi:hypothetical protein